MHHEHHTIISVHLNRAGHQMPSFQDTHFAVSGSTCEILRIVSSQSLFPILSPSSLRIYEPCGVI